MTALFDLACAGCGRPHRGQVRSPGAPAAGGLPAVCPDCGGFWEYRDGLAWRPPRPLPGLRAWTSVFGLEPDELTARTLARPPFLLRGSIVYQQGSAAPPGGSFKERGAEVLAAACARRGLGEVFLDSSGNAGIAMARAAAERGIACRVLVPLSTPRSKLARLQALGATVEVIPGDRQATYEAAQARVHDLPYASHIVQPFFHAGVATLAWDLDLELHGGSEGDAQRIERVILPAGNGSLLLGLTLGFDRLVRAGRLERMPRFHAVQLAGYASLAPGGPGERGAGAPAAAGIAIEAPPRRCQMAAAVERSGGDVTVVTGEEVERARGELAADGVRTDPTGATAWAGLTRRPELAGGRTVVLVTSTDA